MSGKGVGVLLIILVHHYAFDMEYPFPCTVNPEIFARILFLRIALKDIFATFKILD